MSALYHRLGFLDLNQDEIGIGHQYGDINSYVYVMGNSALNSLCSQPSFSGYGTYNFEICIDKKQRLEKSLVDKAKQIHQIKNPNIVVWPAKNAQNITPAFYQESPDPLPHHSVSGYPISIQFNPSFFKMPPKITNFMVLKTNQKIDLKAITIMNKNNDPNNKLSAYQHAFFPEHRLEWDSSYTVKIDYLNQDNNQTHHLNWSFHTKNFKAPIITVTQDTKIINVKEGQNYILYFPPEHANDDQATLSSRDYNMQLKLNYIDNNTLNAYISHQGKAEIKFHNKTIELSTHKENYP